MYFGVSCKPSLFLWASLYFFRRHVSQRRSGDGDGWRELDRAQIDEFRHNMGFDQPWYVQYGNFLSKSHHWRPRRIAAAAPAQLAVDRRPHARTLELALAAMLISTVVAIPAGIISATGAFLV